MNAFLVFHGTVRDAEKFQAYAEGAGKTLPAHGGEITLRGKLADVLDGTHRHDIVGIIRFPDLDSAYAWYHSDDYQALIELRNAAADVTVLGFETPEAA